MMFKIKRRLYRSYCRYELRLRSGNWLRIKKLEMEPKVFCLSMQRCGTTSVGRFFRDFGFRWVGWALASENRWSRSWYEGNIDEIFSSIDFRIGNAFEDSPWWFPEFYKVLFERFPSSKFVLFERDPDDWFASMKRHSNGNILGSSRVHSRLYGREEEFQEILRTKNYDEDSESEWGSRSKKYLSLNGMDEHYKNVFKRHNAGVKDFFRSHARDSLYVGSLNDSEKWIKLGCFLGLEVPTEYDCHENRARD